MDSGKYFVLWPDGQRFGPADVPTLNAWITENRINKNSSVEPEGNPGAIMPLENVPGIVLPDPVPTPEPTASPQPDPGAVSASDLNDPFKQQSSGAATTTGGYDPVQPSGTSPTTQSEQQRLDSPYNPGSYQQPGQTQQPQSYANYPRHQAQGDDGQSDITLSFVFSAIGFVTTIITFFFGCPLIGGALSIPGLVFASKAKQKHHPSAQAANVAAWISVVIAILAQIAIIVLGVVLASQIQSDLGI